MKGVQNLSICHSLQRTKDCNCNILRNQVKTDLGGAWCDQQRPCDRVWDAPNFGHCGRATFCIYISSCIFVRVFLIYILAFLFISLFALSCFWRSKFWQTVCWYGRADHNQQSSLVCLVFYSLYLYSWCLYKFVLELQCVDFGSLLNVLAEGQWSAHTLVSIRKWPITCLQHFIICIFEKLYRLYFSQINASGFWWWWWDAS